MAMTKQDSDASIERGMNGGTADLNALEAPITARAVFSCIMASFGGFFFGYDAGYINGVTGSPVFIKLIEGPGATSLTTPNSSLIVSILSAGTFFGAIIAGDFADYLGRKPTIIIGCLVYIVGVILQTAAQGLGLLVAGRLIAGLGVGFVSAIVILYMSEICPKKIRGAMVSGYQFAITIGILTASCVNYAVQDRTDTGSYRIPIAIQFLPGLVLGLGMLLLPESPRWLVKRGRVDQAASNLATLRSQGIDSHYIQAELAEIVANNEVELASMPAEGWLAQWTICFSGSLWNGASNIRRTILGTSLQMMQQWTGVNFIFYFSTPFLQATGAVKNPFIISLVFTLVNVLSTPISFYTIERFGRRTLLIYGAAGMLICQFLVAIIGVTIGFNKTMIVDGVDVAVNKGAVNAQVAFIAIFIFFFASTWGPGAWVLIGEIFPLPMRSRGVALSTSSNWLWNTIIGVITPYMVGKDKGNLKSSVFFIWGGLCTCALIYSYFLVPETKGLSLEQIDQMMAESTPRTSASWKPSTTYAADAQHDIVHRNQQKATADHVEKA